MYVNARAPARAHALSSALLCLCLLASACTGGEETTPTASADKGDRQAAQRAARSDAKGSQESTPVDLRGMGYADYAEEEDWSTVDGLVFHDAQLASPGYTFYVDIPSAHGYLIDMEGRERASWTLEHAREWSRGIILPDGDLLAVGIADHKENRVETEEDTGAQPGGFLLRMNWAGEVLWRKQIGAHHDVELTPRGQILVLGQSRKASTERNPECGIIDNSVMLLSADGELLDELSAYDLLRSAPQIHRFAERHSPTKCAKGFPSDCLHLNSCRWLERPDLAERHALYEVGNVLISSRTQNSIAIFNLARRELIWSWGRGTILGQHEAQLLDNGHILLLDNGAKTRPFSRVIEMNPVDGEIVWSYSASPPKSFFTPGRGTVQRLPNDNILIASSNQGQIFEVTRKGEVVWRYHNPHFTLKGKRKKRGVLRAQRYTPQWIEPWLRTAQEAQGEANEEAADTASGKTPSDG